MKLLTVLILSLTALFTIPAKANVTAQKQSVDNACYQEARYANCGDKRVGTGLIKCIHNYKSVNKAFQISEPCKAALSALTYERKAQQRKY